MPALRSILVADIGGTSMKLGAVVGGEPQAAGVRISSERLRCEDPLAAMDTILRSFTAENGLSFDAVVMTIPGFIDRDFDHVLHAANIPQLNGLAVASGLSERLDAPVFLERDVVLLLQGERLKGAASGVESVLGLFFGTGVGAALIDRGKVFRGDGWALEIGHMPIHGDADPLDGLKAGSLEVYASGRRLNHLAETHGVPVGELFAHDGSPALDSDLATFVRDQAFAAASAMLMLCPQRLVLGGGVLEMNGYPQGVLLETIRERASLPPGRDLDIRFASRGWRAVLDAAVHLVETRRSLPHTDLSLLEGASQ
jgi:allose kinase